MNKMIISLVVVALAAFALADEAIKLTATDLTPEQMKARRERIREKQMRTFGGYLINEPKGNGRIGILNAQSRVSSDELEKTAKYVQKFGKLPVEVKSVKLNQGDRATTAMVDAAGVKVGLFVVDDPKCDLSILIAPEARWAVVNVEALAKDKPSGELLAMRTRKQVARALCLLCGAGASQYPNTLLAPKKDYATLDRYKDEGLPPDVFMRMSYYMKDLGVHMIVRDTYAEACREGWAPPPTNQYQKAIYDTIKSGKEWTQD